MKYGNENNLSDLPVRSMLYRSRNAIEISPLILATIIEKSIQNNQRDGITGLLIYDDGEFVQYIEGAPQQVSRCWDRIRLDNRHEELDLLLDAPRTQRAVPQWSMKLLHEMPNDPAMVAGHDLTRYLDIRAA